MHSAIRDIENEFHLVKAFNFKLSAQNRIVPSSSDADENTMSETHSVCEGTMMFSLKSLPILLFSNLLVFGPARYGVESDGLVDGSSN